MKSGLTNPLSPYYLTSYMDSPLERNQNVLTSNTTEEINDFIPWSLVHLQGIFDIFYDVCKNPDLCNTPHSYSSLWGKFGINFTATILSALKGAKSFMYLQVSQIECGN